MCAYFLFLVSCRLRFLRPESVRFWPREQIKARSQERYRHDERYGQVVLWITSEHPPSSHVLHQRINERKPYYHEVNAGEMNQPINAELVRIVHPVAQSEGPS